MTTESTIEPTTGSQAPATPTPAETAPPAPAPAPTPQDLMHQNASLCITFEPPADAPLASQPPADPSLTPCNTSESCAQMLHAPQPHPFDLTPAQLKALELLLAGLPDVHVAQVLGVNRTTVYRWRHFHPAFVAEFNRRRLDSWESCQQRLRHLLPRALSSLGKGLRSQNPYVTLQSAKAILANTAPDKEKLPPRPGSTSPEQFIDSFVHVIRRQKGKDPHKPVSDKERQHVMEYLLQNLRT